MNSISPANTEAIRDKYHFYYDKTNRSVICTTIYKGQLIRAVAKCDPEDSFDKSTGEKLAYLRCRQKFLRKKANHAAGVYAKAYAAGVRAEERLSQTSNFVKDVTYELAEVNNALATLEDSLES